MLRGGSVAGRHGVEKRERGREKCLSRSLPRATRRLSTPATSRPAESRELKLGSRVGCSFSLIFFFSSRNIVYRRRKGRPGGARRNVCSRTDKGSSLERVSLRSPHWGLAREEEICGSDNFEGRTRRRDCLFFLLYLCGLQCTSMRTHHRYLRLLHI